MKVLGKVMPRFLGNYDPTFTYDVIDIVSHNGLWVTKIPNVIGVEPSETNAEQWLQIMPAVEGSAGKSAYECAKEAGYTGTEAEFAVKLAMDVYSKTEIDSKFTSVNNDLVKLDLETAHYITPEMYGAVGDGVTDDSEAIQTAINEAGSTDVVYLAKKTYLINDTIVLSERPSIFKCDGTIYYTGTGVGIIVTRSQVKAEIEMIDAPNGTAIQSNSGNHGLECGTHSISDCDIRVNIINSSVVGLHQFSDSEPQTYNKFHINKIVSSKECVLVECTDDTYINECYYWLGKMTGGCEKPVKIVKGGSHKFFSGAFEGVASDGTAIWLENSNANIFRNIRCYENYGATIIKFVGECEKNDIELSELDLTKVDISELADIGGNFNVLRAPSMGATYGRCGTVAHVNKRNGVSYITTNGNNARFDVNATNFPDNVIKQVDNCIPNTLYFNNANTNGATFTMGNVYSGYGSLALGCPIAMKFHDTNGKVKLVDVNGDTILDNTDGKYSGKTLSVRWAGYDYFYGNHIWDVQVMGETPLYESDLDTAITEALTEAKESGEFKGDTGATGEKGADGTSVTVKSVSESTADGGSNIVTFSDGKTLTIKNGSKGSTGTTGANGSDATVTKTNIENALGYTPASESKAETWTFTLADGSTVPKKVVLA